VLLQPWRPAFEEDRRERMLQKDLGGRGTAWYSRSGHSITYKGVNLRTLSMLIPWRGEENA